MHVPAAKLPSCIKVSEPGQFQSGSEQTHPSALLLWLSCVFLLHALQIFAKLGNGWYKTLQEVKSGWSYMETEDTEMFALKQKHSLLIYLTILCHAELQLAHLF